MGIIFRKNFAWFWWQGLESSSFVIYQPTIVNRKTIMMNIQFFYNMINFILSFREPFPLSRITAYNILLTFLIRIFIR